MLKLAGTLMAMAALAFVASPVATAAAGGDVALGTWKLDGAKSKFSPGPAPKSQVRTYKDSGGSTALSWTTVGADGKESTGGSTFKYDGKDYPITGMSDFDAISLKSSDDGRTVESTAKRAGKAVGTATRAVSKDGKTLTLTMKGTSASGAAYDSVMVFDKQ